MDDITALKHYLRTKDPEAFLHFVTVYQGMVYSVCRRLLVSSADAEDATQETFLKLARNAGSIRSNVAAWLYSCATGTAKDLFRKEATRRQHHQTAWMESRQGARTESAEIIARLDEALAQLEPVDRELICGRFFAGRTQSELALAYGVSQSLISRRIRKVLKRLHQQMNRMGYSVALAALAPALETEAACVAVPASVNTALVKIGLSGAGQASTFKIGALIMALTTKVKIAVATAAAVLLVGGSVAVVNLRTSTHPSVRLSADLAEDYKLFDGENIRLLRTPFPAKRDELLESHLNNSRMFRGIERWDCVFDWYAGELRWRAGTEPRSERERLDWIAKNVLGLDWYNLGDHGTLPASAGDWVVRADLTLEQKLEGYAQALEHTSGREISFERTQVRRDCIVRRAEPVPSRAEQANPPTLLLTTSSPPYSEDMPNAAVGHTISFQTWCAQTGLPFIDESADSMIPVAMYSIMPDADLKRGDPKLRTKLNRVLRNLEYQMGGTFKVESREVEVWTPVVQ